MIPLFDDLQVVPIGGPTARLELGGLRLLTDPTFSPPGEHVLGPGLSVTKTIAPVIGVDDLGRIDAVLLSHDQHPDNLDPAGRELFPRVPLVLTHPLRPPTSAGRPEASPTASTSCWTAHVIARCASKRSPRSTARPGASRSSDR
jgi:hypothetical protein